MSCHSSALTRCHKLAHPFVATFGGFRPGFLTLFHRPFHGQLQIAPYAHLSAVSAVEKLPLSKPVIESLYKETGRLLEAVDGQEQEHMLAINARTGEPVMTVIFLQLFPLKSRLQKSTNGHIITLGSNLIPILQRHWLPSCSMMKIKNIHYLT